MITVIACVLPFRKGQHSFSCAVCYPLRLSAVLFLPGVSDMGELWLAPYSDPDFKQKMDDIWTDIAVSGNFSFFQSCWVAVIVDREDANRCNLTQIPQK